MWKLYARPREYVLFFPLLFIGRPGLRLLSTQQGCASGVGVCREWGEVGGLDHACVVSRPKLQRPSTWHICKLTHFSWWQIKKVLPVLCSECFPSLCLPLNSQPGLRLLSTQMREENWSYHDQKKKGEWVEGWDGWGMLLWAVADYSIANRRIAWTLGRRRAYNFEQRPNSKAELLQMWFLQSGRF